MPRKTKRRRLPKVKVKVATEWMDAHEAALYLRLSEPGLYQMVRRGLLDGVYHIGNRTLIFCRSEIDAAIRARPVKGKPQKKRRKRPA